MKRWRRGVMATLVGQWERASATGCRKCAPGSAKAQVGQAEKADSQPGPEKGAGREGVTPSQREKATLAPAHVWATAKRFRSTTTLSGGGRAPWIGPARNTTGPSASRITAARTSLPGSSFSLADLPRSTDERRHDDRHPGDARHKPRVAGAEW